MKTGENETKQKKKASADNQRIIDSYDYLTNAASTQDCTGLIPSIPQSEGELESYSSLYKFLSPKVPDKNSED